MFKKFSRNKNHEFHENTVQELFSSIMHVIMNYLLLMNYYFWSSRVCFLSMLPGRINGLVYWCTIHCHESYDSLRIQKSSPIYIDLVIVYKQSWEKDIRVIKGNDIYVSLCSLKKTKFHTIFAMIKNQE